MTNSATAQQGAPNSHTSVLTPAPAATGVAGGKDSQGNPATGGDPAQWSTTLDFHAEAGTEENSFLGCDVSFPCSLVVIPNWGGKPTDCADHSADFGFGTSGNAFGSGLSHPCTLADRIVIPLSFTPTPANCPPKNPTFFAQGSPMMLRAMNEWIAGYCVGQSPVSLNYVFRTTEAAARSSFLNGSQAASASTDMALVTLPPDASAAQASGRKFTYAPLANSAQELAYYVDDSASRVLLTHLVMNPRLFAKVLTESYSLGYDCTGTPPSPWSQQPGAPSITCDPAVTHNPQTLYDDTEFEELNTQCEPQGQPASYKCTAATDFPTGTHDHSQDSKAGTIFPTVLAGDSDMTFELTRWIGSNQDAAQFLAGKVDPSGMHVNTNYWGQQYPSAAFVALDDGTTYPGMWCNPDATNSCTGGINGTQQTGATMQVAWNPVTGLDTMANDLVTDTPTALSDIYQCTANQCTASGTGFTPLPLAAQSQGARNLFSQMDLGDGASYAFPAVQVVNAAGKAVGPTAASITAALHDMKTNPDGITQYSNDTTTDPNAYPLTMVDYAMVPTCGLSSTRASAIADFLTKVATTGQEQGVAPGELAPGYYPLTSAQRAQTLAAAKAVKTQNCVSAKLDKTVSGKFGVNNVASPKGPAVGSSAAPGSARPGSGKAGPGAGRGTADSTLRNAAYGVKSPFSGIGGVLLLLATILGGLLLVGGPSAWVITVTGRWPVVLGWLRAIGSRLRMMPGRLPGVARRS